MTTKEIFESIITKPKWYAGIKATESKFYTAQSANRIKDRYRRGVLSDVIIEKVLNSHGYYKADTVWIKKENR